MIRPHPDPAPRIELPPRADRDPRVHFTIRRAPFDQDRLPPPTG